MDAATIVSLVGALGLGSIVGQVVSGGPQRREVRARVLAALDACESSRWAGGSAMAHGESFPERARELEAAALVARIPRAAVAQYLWLSFAGYWLSCESADQDPDGEGGIRASFSETIRSSASVLVDAAWAPWRARLGMMRKLAAVAEHADSESAPDIVRLIQQAKSRVGLPA